MARDGYRIFDAGIQAAVFLGFRGRFWAYVAALSQGFQTSQGQAR